MLGAIVGDIVGSRFELKNHRSRDFGLFTPQCRPTGDTVMTLAVAQVLLSCTRDYRYLIEEAVSPDEGVLPTVSTRWLWAEIFPLDYGRKNSTSVWELWQWSCHAYQYLCFSGPIIGRCFGSGICSDPCNP